MEEVVLASSPVDAGIGCWNLRSGAENLRYRTCASPPHSLISVARRFLASAQLRESSSSSSSSQIFFWSWDKPHVEVKSFPAEPVGPLVSDSDGAYLVGGGSSGAIYIWELSSGRLLSKWNAHYRSVTCLALSDDQSLLVSGSADGSIKVWSLMMMFDDMGKAASRNPYLYSFSEHTLRVTDVVSGNGMCNSLVVSASEDRTCKIWSLSEGQILRSITFPCIIDSIVLDPAEHVFYAGGRDGRIYIASLTGECNANSTYGKFIIGSLSDQSKAITCLTFSMDGFTLVSGSEDGTIRVWDTKSRHVVRIIKHTKGPVSNVLIVEQPIHKSPQGSTDTQVSSRKRIPLPPPLDKYINSTDGDAESKSVTVLKPAWHDPQDSRYCSSHVTRSQIKELQQQGSSSAVEMELESLRLECKRSVQVIKKWKKLYLNLQTVCMNELLGEAQLEQN